MADTIQFDKYRGTRPDCLHTEDLLADAVDGLLAESEQTVFDRHIAGCDACSALLADARRGAAWLELLKTPRPEPSAQLLERILARTADAGLGAEDTAAHQLPSHRLQPDEIAGLPVLQPHFEPRRFAPAMRQPAAQAWSGDGAGMGIGTGTMVPFPPRPLQPPAALNWKRVNRVLFEPRLAMTAAMAFFSIALTLNLAGVHVDQLHARDLKPTNLRRSYYEASASAIRRYDSLRVVHVLESRVDDLRESSGAERPLSAGSGSSADVPESRRDQPRRDQPANSSRAPETPSGRGGAAQSPDGVRSDDAPGEAPGKNGAKPTGPGMSQRQPLLPEPHFLRTARPTAPSHPAGGLA